MVRLRTERRRHELAMALKRAGWNLQEAEYFVGVIGIVAGDCEVDDRIRAVRDTYAKPDIEPITGLNRRGEFIGSEMLRSGWHNGCSYAPML
ncbi:MAG: hypothetical protein RMJ88_11020 [Thermogemmata sp.]|nr:hypothetical protein [Thermogemmata sp.]